MQEIQWLMVMKKYLNAEEQEEMILIKNSFIKNLKRFVKMDVDQEDLNRLEFSLNSYLEDKGKLVELSINGKEILIKRNKSMYFIEDFGWTNTLGIYYFVTE